MKYRQIAKYDNNSERFNNALTMSNAPREIVL
jgi:hypothetical protein